jgi:hypothetical protein
MPMQLLIVSGSYQNYQNGAVSNQLTDGGRGESVLGFDSESVETKSALLYELTGFCLALLQCTKVVSCLSLFSETKSSSDYSF